MNVQGCKARNQHKLVCEKFENFKFCNNVVRSFSINGFGESRYNLLLEVEQLDKENILEFSYRMEASLTAYIGFHQYNQQYGTGYIKFDRFNMKIIDLDEVSNGIELSETWSRTDTSTVKLDLKEIKDLYYNPIIQLYSDGLRANSSKSKFFYWLVIPPFIRGVISRTLLFN